MKLVAQIRVKDGILTIEECLNKLSDLVDEIVIVDNGSTDGTLEIYKKFPKIVDIAHTQGFDEGRDKRLELEMSKKRNPDWILWVDQDEIFEKSLKREDLEKYMQNPKINEVKFRMFNFWLSKTHFRIDGRWLKYSTIPQRQMWRNLPSVYFDPIRFHSGGAKGLTGKPIISNFRIKHYGYIAEIQIGNKQKTYDKLKSDPRSVKTLPMDIEGMKRMRFLESENGFINRIYQIIYAYFALIYNLIQP